jgi:4Fe-4S ferredoxin
MSVECAGTPGKVAPVVDRNRCEAKADCVVVCPYHVFEVRALAPGDRAGMSWLGRLRTWGHGGRQAYVVRPGDCHACNRCVDACPEDAIRLLPAH